MSCTFNRLSYSPPLREMLNRLKEEYEYSELDAGLVLKDILAHLWNYKE